MRKKINSQYLLFFCRQLLNLHILKDWPMDLWAAFLLRWPWWRPAEGFETFGQRPTSRHQSFRVTATPAALPNTPLLYLPPPPPDIPCPLLPGSKIWPSSLNWDFIVRDGILNRFRCSCLMFLRCWIVWEAVFVILTNYLPKLFVKSPLSSQNPSQIFSTFVSIILCCLFRKNILLVEAINCLSSCVFVSVKGLLILW